MGYFTSKKLNYSYIDSPYDMLYLCDPKTENININCAISEILGFSSGYIFPFVGFIGVVSNIYICYIFLFRYPKRTRQTILLSYLALADLLNILAFGWLWIFPAKGLPYMTNGNIYFFIINQSSVYCTVFRTLYFFTSTVTFAIFLLVCLDRCFAIYFPFRSLRITNKMTFLTCSIVFLFCLPLTVLYTGFIRTIYQHPYFFCTIGNKDKSLNLFLNLYRVLIVHSGVLFTVGIIISNLALILKLVLLSKTNLLLIKTKSNNIQREIRSTITILILSLIFLSGSLPNTCLFFIMKSLQNDSTINQNYLQFLYSLTDAFYQLLIWIESFSFLVYVIRMKNFRALILSNSTKNLSITSTIKNKITFQLSNVK
uniref:GCR117 n=1 Tax=Schmidtea mediterranea TaxID=79327 RepID=A0A193KUC7_SCHMD|nr:GCR117 [Schmidtea mediterranea]